MLIFAWIIAVMIAAGWSYKLVEVALGMPKVADITNPEWAGTAGDFPKLSIIVPALNEAAAIEPALRSLLTLDYPDYEVIAINDRSTDETGAIMERVASESAGRIKVVHVRELPAGARPSYGRRRALSAASQVYHVAMPGPERKAGRQNHGAAHNCQDS